MTLTSWTPRSPDGALLATGSKDKTARIWSVSDGAHRSTLTGHTYRVTATEFSPDGRTVATSSSDDQARSGASSDQTSRRS